MTTKTQIKEKVQDKNKLSRCKLELLSGPMDGLEFEIKKEELIIGREVDNDIALPLDSLISRSHARITCENGEYWLEDLGSSNGTYIGENRIEEKVRLPLGTIFRVGVCEMRLTNIS